MIFSQNASKPILIPRRRDQLPSRRITPITKEATNKPIEIDSNEFQFLSQKRMRSEQLIKNFTELLQSSSSDEIEKIKLSLESRTPHQTNSELLYCHQCFSIEFVGKMITCSNQHCKKTFCCNCFKAYHVNNNTILYLHHLQVNHLEQINFNLTNGNWICFECMVNQQQKSKEQGNDSLLIAREVTEEAKEIEEIKSACENYYLNKSMGENYFRKKCRHCKAKAFHINELLHFSSIQQFLRYIDHLFKEQRSVITYDEKEIHNNKKDIRQYIGKESSYNKEWCFSYAKAICKGCLLLLLNQRNSIAIIENILKDPEDGTVINHNDNNDGTYITPSCSLIHSKPKPSSLCRLNLVKQPEQIPKALLPNHFHLWGKTVNDFNQEVNALNSSILRTIGKLIKGARLFNQLYIKSPIQHKDFEEYLNKIVLINNQNKDKISAIVNAYSTHRKFLFSIIDYGNAFISSNSCKKYMDTTTFQVKIRVSQFEDEFNHYGNMVLGFVQTLSTLQTVTLDYIDNLKEQPTAV